MTNDTHPRAPALDYPEGAERAEISEAFRDFLTRACPAEVVRRAAGTDGFDAALWKAFADIGGISASLPGPVGGGGTLHDARLIGVECGRCVAPIPYAEAVSTVRLLSRIRPSVESDVPWLALTEQPSQGTWLTGAGAAAQRVVLVRQREAAGYALTAECVRPLENLGELPMAHLDLAHARQLFTVPVTLAIRETWLSERRILTASTLLGAGTQALTMAREHLLVRHQFGRPLGSFQALQHRLADRATQLTAAHLLMISACDTLAANGPAGPYRSALALASAAQAAELAAREALQMFGGYGYTLDYDVHLYLRYIKATAVLARDDDVEPDAIAPHLETRRS